MNKHVTTLTYETKLVPETEETYVTPSMLDVVKEYIATKTEVKHGFKNSFIVTLHVSSPRVGTIRKISIKIFRNLRLHVTGAHCLEMLQNVVDMINDWISECTKIVMREDIASRQIDVVLYKYQLPGNLNLLKVKNLLNHRKILSIYDPNNYAGVRAKIPVQDEKEASVMIFRKGKLIIIIPRQHNYDNSLTFVINEIETLLLENWNKISSSESYCKMQPVKRKRD